MATPTTNYVQVPPNSTGLKIRTIEVTDSAGNIVECQAIVIADPTVPTQIADVTPLNALAVDVIGSANLAQIASALEYHSALLEAILTQLGGIVPTRTN